MVTLTINGQTVQVPAGTTILEAAEKAGIKIPTLCYLKDINKIAACRMCVVEVEGSDRLAAACDTPVEEGLVVHTNTPKVRKARRVNMELLLSQHASYCSTCIRSGNCPLQKLANDLNIHEMPYHVHVARGYTDTSTPLVRQASKCIKCMRCVQICEKVQTMGIWDLAGTGSRTTVDVSGNRTLKTSDCTFCGQCVTHCPTGALTARDDTVSFIKSQFPHYVDCLSTAKSPQQMFGAVAKTYFAEKIGVDPHRMFVVSIMPCMAKKSECALPTMRDACGDPDVDAVLTTREMDRLVRSDNIQPGDLPEEAFDSPLGTGTGAAVIFGATGGVMDAALRSAYYLVTGENPDPDAFTAVRGNKPWKEAVFSIPGAGEIRVAVVSGLGNTRKLMKALESGQGRYDFVEVMACPGGCAGGGGQPIHDGEELAGKREDALWKLDQKATIRFSHENPEIQSLYQEFLERPLGKKSHHLLHTDHTTWEVVEKGIWLDSN